MMTIRIFLMLCLLMALPLSANAQTFKLNEYLGEDWSGERVSFPATVPAEMDAERLAVRGDDGKVLPAQFVPESAGSRKGLVYFIVDLPAKATQNWTLVDGIVGAKTDIFMTSGTDKVEFGTSSVAVRVPMGAWTSVEGKPAEEVSAPIQSVRLVDGTWAGSGHLYSPYAVTSFMGEVVTSGPVFTRIKLTYSFAGGKQYVAELEAIAGQPVVLVNEKYSLNTRTKFLEPTRPSNAPQGNYTVNAYGRRLYTQGSFWSLSMAEGLEPDRLALNHWSGGIWGKDTAPGEPPATFELDNKKGPIVTLNPSAGEWWMNCSQWAGAYSTKGKGFLAVMTLRAGAWVDPHENVIVVENGSDGRLRSVMPINNGGRTWGLFSCDSESAVAVRGEEPDARRYPGVLYPRPAHLATIKYGLLPLDTVKDWSFEFSDPKGTVFPHIYAKADELQQIRKSIADSSELSELIDRLKWQWDNYRESKDPDYPLYPERIMDPRGLDNLYLATGDESYAKDLALLLIDRMRFYVHQTRAGVGITGYRWSHGYGMFHLTTGPLPLFIRETDIALGSPSITTEQKKDIRALLAFFGELFGSSDYFSPNYNNGNTDMVASFNESLGKIASVINGHPKAKEWAVRSARGIEEGLSRGWVVPTIEQDEWYAMLSLEMITQTAVCLKNAGLYDLFKDKRYRDALDYFGKLLVPPDPRYGGGYVVPFGNGQAQWLRSAIWGVAAAAVKDEDPEFASRLMWYWDRSGRLGTFRYGDMEPGGWASLGWLDPSIPAVSPQFASQSLSDWGVLFRNGYGTQDETLLALQVGKRDGLANYLNAEGGMILHAYGVPLVLNSGLRSWDQQVNNNTYNLTGQRFLANRPSFDNRNEVEAMYKTGKLIEWSNSSQADLASGEWTFKRLVAYKNPGPNSGPDEFELSKPRAEVPGLEYGFIDIKSVEPITWRRHVMFVKDADPSGPNYFVIRDYAKTPVTWDWSISSLASSLDIKGDAGSFTGKYGVDLDLVPITSIPELVTGTWGPSKSFAGDWRQKLYQVRLPNSGEMAAILFPRKHGQPAPIITPWAGAQGAKVVMTDAVHYVLLADGMQKVDSDGVRIDGRAATVIQKGDSVTLSLLSGTKVGIGDVELVDATAAGKSSGSITVTVDKTALSVKGETHGTARTITLMLPEVFAVKSVMVDGQAVTVTSVKAGTIQFAVPQGDHTYSLGL